MVGPTAKEQSMPRTAAHWQEFMRLSQGDADDRGKSHALRDMQWPEVWLSVNKCHLKRIRNEFDMTKNAFDELLRARRRHQNRLAARRSRLRKTDVYVGAPQGWGA
jgi:hypothetical protein